MFCFIILKYTHKAQKICQYSNFQCVSIVQLIPFNVSKFLKYFKHLTSEHEFHREKDILPLKAITCHNCQNREICDQNYYAVIGIKYKRYNRIDNENKSCLFLLC